MSDSKPNAVQPVALETYGTPGPWAGALIISGLATPQKGHTPTPGSPRVPGDMYFHVIPILDPSRLHQGPVLSAPRCDTLDTYRAQVHTDYPDVERSTSVIDSSQQRTSPQQNAVHEKVVEHDTKAPSTSGMIPQHV